jgi:hydrogenase expression/formation protein HypE
VATTLNEIARQSDVCIVINESSIPVKPPVRAACEMFGFDPLYMANEGKLIAIVPPSSADEILNVMKTHTLGIDAVVIGEVQASPKSKVLMKTTLGATHMLDMLSGELLPRIC